MGQLGLFVEQVEDVDFINLFLTNIGSVALTSSLMPLRLTCSMHSVPLLLCLILYRQGPSPDDIVNPLMDGIREELEKKDLSKYVNSILTAHVMKRPPDHEGGLAVLLRLRGASLLFKRTD